MMIIGGAQQSNFLLVVKNECWQRQAMFLDLGSFAPKPLPAKEILVSSDNNSRAQRNWKISQQIHLIQIFAG